MSVSRLLFLRRRLLSSSSSSPSSSSSSSSSPRGGPSSPWDAGSKAERKARKARHDEILCTSRDVVEGRRIVQDLGVVVGTSVKSRHMGSDLLARLKSFFMGGELRGYTALLNAATLEATRVALDTADELGATSLVRVRFQASTTMDSMSGAFTQVMCYGTAVKCVPLQVQGKGEAPADVALPPPDIEMIHCSSAEEADLPSTKPIPASRGVSSTEIPHVNVELARVLPGKERELRKVLMALFDISKREADSAIANVPAMLTYCPSHEGEEIAETIAEAGGEIVLHPVSDQGHNPPPTNGEPQ